MARRPKKADVPAKPMKKSAAVFQGNGPARERSPFVSNHSRVVGDPQSGLTTNRSKPSGGPGSSGPTTNVD